MSSLREQDIIDLKQKILSLEYQVANMAGRYRHGPYGRTHFKEVSLLASMMLIQLEYILNDMSREGHDGKDEG